MFAVLKIIRSSLGGHFLSSVLGHLAFLLCLPARDIFLLCSGVYLHKRDLYQQELCRCGKGFDMLGGGDIIGVPSV